MSALRDAMVYGLDGRAAKIWNGVKPFVFLAAYVGFVVICMKEWLPVWLGFAIFMLPTVGFVVGVIIALCDPYWFVSRRPSSGGAKITLDGKRGRD